MKKLLSFAVIAGLLTIVLIALTGCENGGEQKNNTVEISETLGKGVISLKVPKNEDGTPKYNFTTEKPQNAQQGSLFLVTDTAVFSFSTSIMTYNTSKVFKEKNGEVNASFEGYLEWMKDPESTIKLSGMEQFEINGRKALRYYNREGGSGQYKYYGYFYLVGVDDIYPKSRLDMTVRYNETDLPDASKEFDSETLEIINSLKVTADEV